MKRTIHELNLAEDGKFPSFDGDSGLRYDASAQLNLYLILNRYDDRARSGGVTEPSHELLNLDRRSHDGPEKTDTLSTPSSFVELSLSSTKDLNVRLAVRVQTLKNKTVNVSDP